MSPSVDFGILTDRSQGLGAQPPAAYDMIAAVAASGTDTDQQVAEKAVNDSMQTPSVWFVNFPSKAAAGQQELLGKYMQNVQNYRSWASLVWWKTVFAADPKKIPQDGSSGSAATRSAYCARVAVKHMQTTPWLAMNENENYSKTIECNVQEFHTELIQAVLAGFVGVTPGIIVALEGILESLRKTMGQSKSNSENRTIVCERYEYIPQANAIRSYVRIISFSVNESIQNVQSHKQTSTTIKCSIDYNNYDATFNQELWGKVSAKIDEDQLQASDAFRKQQTIDCEP